VLGRQAKPCDQGVIAAARPTEDCVDRSKPFVLAVTIAASAMAFIDASMIDIVLPVIGREFAAAVGDLQWVVNTYVLVNAALALIGGAAGDRFGRRRIFTAGIVVFAAGSVGCGMAPGVAALVIARAVQGVGCALMVPTSLAIVGATFPEAERGKAIGTWAGVTAIAGVIAPTFGGWLADAISWRAIFFVNIPIALVTLFFTARHVPQSRVEGAPAHLDWSGAMLAALGLGAVTFGLIQAGDRGWHDPLVVGSALLGGLLLVAFIVVEARSAAPMMPLALFRSRTFSGVNLMTLLLYMALGAAFFFIPFDLIRIQGYTAAEAGAAFLPFPLIMAVLSRWSGGLLDRFGARLPLVVGALITAAGFALLARAGVGLSYWIDFFPAMVVLGLGMTVTVAPLTTTVMNAVPGARVGVASAINNSVTDVSTLLAIAIFGAAGRALFAATLDAELARLTLPPELLRLVQAIKDSLVGAAVPSDVPSAERAILIAAVGHSFVTAFRMVMIGAAALSLAASLTAAVTIDHGRRSLQAARRAPRRLRRRDRRGRAGDETAAAGPLASTLDLVRIEQRDQPRLSQAFWLSLPARRKSGSGARAQTSSAATEVAVGEKRRVTLIR
jgi:EmrB/QacA subfamily drug resistance transporter